MNQSNGHTLMKYYVVCEFVCHHLQMQLLSATIAVACMFATTSEATKDAVQHCNDKMRGLIENSCKTIMSAHKQRQEMYEAYPSIVKRENHFDPDYYVEYLEGNCKLITYKKHEINWPDFDHAIIIRYLLFCARRNVLPPFPRGTGEKYLKHIVTARDNLIKGCLVRRCRLHTVSDILKCYTISIERNHRG